MKPWTTQDYERIRAMREKKLPWHEVAFALGRTLQTTMAYVEGEARRVGRADALPLLPVADGYATYERWTPEQDARVLELRRAGYTYDAIASHIGREPKAVRTRGTRLLERVALRDVAGRDATYAQLTVDERRIVDAKLNQGLTVRAIARELGRNWWVVSTHEKFYRRRA